VAQAAGIDGERFLDAYLRNQGKANNEAVDAHPIAFAIVKLMRNKDTWKGNATALLKALNTIAENEQIDTKSYLWAKQPNQLSRRLREVVSNLAELGLQVEFLVNGGARGIRISNKGTPIDL
jgi:hypothetical protein